MSAMGICIIIWKMWTGFKDRGKTVNEKKRQSKKNPDLSWLEENPLRLDEEIKTISFRCLNCGKEDEAPDFVANEFG